MRQLISTPEIGIKTPDHLHDWYPYWDKTLGNPAGKCVVRDDSAYQREFANGTVIYNPLKNDKPVTVKFNTKPRVRRGSGQRTSPSPKCSNPPATRPRGPASGPRHARRR